MSTADDVSRLRAEFDAAIASATTLQDLQAVRDRFLGRKQGLVTALYAGLGRATPDERRTLGQLANALKRDVEAGLDAAKAALTRAAGRQVEIDVTLDPRPLPVGSRHPLNAMRERIERIFTTMGYEVLDGPETEDDWHNFEALNMPPDHPARDMQDTLYLSQPFARSATLGRDGSPSRPSSDPSSRPPSGASPEYATLLRTHTSAMQIRYMAAHRPPIRIIAPGRVYRRDNLDLTHTPMFQQVEGLVVGEGVTMADLKGTLLGFAQQLFDPQTPVMFKPSFFPYTEPSAEVFIGCQACLGPGCAVCKRTGWLEIGGSGMVHPSVFEAVGIDPERFTGFAFGMGIERIAMLVHRVDDIRTFYENDVRFLEQFAS